MGTPEARSTATAGWLAAAVVVLLVAGVSLVAQRQPVAAVGWAKGEVALTRTALTGPTPTVPATAPASPIPTPRPVATQAPPEPDPTPATTAADGPVGAPPSPLPDLQTDQPREATPAADAPATQRQVVRTEYIPFATVGGVDLHHPGMVVERIGFHQSNHEGARDMTVYDTAAAPLVLETRGRLSGERSAADIVVDPDEVIVAPVSGTIARANAYTLYCDFTDEFAVIVPDGQPGWEVKLLHLVGLQVSPGQRVEGGVTVLARSAHLLPFESQVDEWTAEPSWPHTHLEVVDTAIPNQPNQGSGSEDCS